MIQGMKHENWLVKYVKLDVVYLFYAQDLK